MVKNKKALFVAVALVASFLLPDVASATALKQAGIRLGRLGISATANNDVLVTFKLNNTPTSVAKIHVAFPAGFTITTGTPTVTTSTPTNFTPAYTATPGALTAVATAGTKDIVVSGLTSASLNNTTLYGFVIATGTVQNPGSSGQYNATVESMNGSSVVIDTTSVPVSIYGSSSDQDQVTVTASVAPNFTFTLSGNSDTVPQADPSTIKTSTGVTLTVSTNSPLGYTAYIKSANAALSSATTSATIPTGTFNGSPDTVSAGTSSYTFVPSSGTLCTTSCGAASVVYDGEYNGITGSTGGSFNAAGTFSSFVSRAAYTGGDNFLLKERVAVSTVQPYATDYTDTLTVVAAGNF